MELTPDDNEMYELDKHTARRYRFHGVGVDRPDATVVVACDQHTDPKFLPFRARALTTTTPPAAAVVANVWDALEFIERHEREVHQGFAAPARSAVPYLPLNPADATAVLPVVPAAVPFRGPSVHVVAVPNGVMGAVLPGPALQLRHRSARPVVVRSIKLADGGHLVTLPADGFPGATWEVRVPPAAYVAPAPSPATGPAPYRAEDHAANACSRCGGWVKDDPARMVLPPPLGSLSATHPATLCGSCSDGLVELVNAYVRSEPAPATGPAVGPIATGGFTNVKENAATTGDYCRHCDVFIGFGGAGVAREPEGMSPEWLAAHCWVCRRSAHELQAEAAGKCPNCLATLERCNAGGCGQRQAPGWRVAAQLQDGNGMEVRG